MTEDEVKKMIVKELKAELRKRSLPLNRNKKILMERLLENRIFTLDGVQQQI